MIADVLPMGTWSMIFQSLKNKTDKKRISQKFNIASSDVMESWMHALSHLRNICAHHSRTWNRIFTITPKIYTAQHGQFLTDNTKFYAHAITITHFLSAITNNSRWSSRLFRLFEEYPDIPKEQMGFPADWYEKSVWNFVDIFSD
jgi:abortive infection bacteriophage resistance protein